MWTITEIKERGRMAFKNNYWPSGGAGVLMLLLSTGSASVGSSQGSSTTAEQATETFSSMPQEQQAIIATAVVGSLALIAAVSFALRIFVFNNLNVGCCRFFRKNVEDQTTPFGVVKEGFNDYGRVMVTMLVRDVFLILWMMLFIIPGIVKTYSYRMVPYIIKEHPELSPTEVITRSREMMQGNKGNAFLMDLSFIGWFLLGIITFNIGNIFWANPYYQNTNAALFLELDKNYR